MKLKALIQQCINEVLEEAGKANMLSSSERGKISSAFAKLGVDGNRKFDKKETGLAAVTQALDILGFNLDMVSADIIMGDKGSRMLTFRRKNVEGQDAFTEQPMIENSRIVFNWENLANPGQPPRFEVQCYAS